MFGGLSDEDKGDFDCDNKIHAFLGATIVLQENLMVANLGAEDFNDST